MSPERAAATTDRLNGLDAIVAVAVAALLVTQRPGGKPAGPDPARVCCWNADRSHGDEPFGASWRRRTALRGDFRHDQCDEGRP